MEFSGVSRRFSAGWRRQSIAALLGCFLASALCLQGVAAAVDDTEAMVGKLLAERGMVGAAWMLHRPGDADTIGAAGLRQAGLAERVMPDDRFQVGSIAKPVLTVGVLRLVTQQRVDLGTPVQEILPEVGWDNPWAKEHPVRLRHLLDHTAGLEDATFRHLFSSNARADTPLAQGLGRQPLRFAVRTVPGSEFSYSNIGYTLMAMAIERITGESYEAHLQANVLQPLGMNASTFGHVTQGEQGGASAMVMGHVDGGVPQPTLPMYLRPAGQFVTTAGDMGRFAAFLLDDGMVDGAVFVDAYLLREMGVPRHTRAAKAGLDKGYSLGMWTRDRHGVVGLCHSGETIGFRALMCLYPEHDKAFFIVLNMDSETADYEAFYGLMIEQLEIPRLTRAMPIAEKTADTEAWAGLYRRVPAKVPAFEYLDVIFNQLWLTERDGSLVLRPFFAEGVRLEPVGGRRFIGTEHVAASHILLGDETTGRAVSTGLRNYRQTSPVAMVALWANMLLGLAGMLYVLTVGLWRAVNRWRTIAADPLAPELVALLSVPIAGFLVGRTWQRLGDLTLATGSLAAATAALPIAAIWGLWRVRSQSRGDHWRSPDTWMLLAVLQWCVVLVAWGMLPLRTWA